MTDAYLDAGTGNPLGQSVDGTASYAVEMPPLEMGRVSSNGLITLGGEIFEQYLWEIRWPYATETYKKMSLDETIAPALNLVEMAIARVPWTVEVPEGYEEELKEERKFALSLMDDMEHTWGSFIRQAVTMNRYGFSCHEKVLRKRTKKNGSKFSDGKIGIRCLPIITQDSIASWQWSEDGLHVTGMLQWKNKPAGLRQLVMLTAGQYIPIPRGKYLHFRSNPIKDNPEGSSVLAAVWRAWKYKTALQEHEAMGISSDLRGLKVLYIPPRYLDPNASDEDKNVYEYYKQIMRNLHTNEQSGLILPQVLDDKGEQYFKFDLMSMTGQKTYDVSAVIKRYEKDIITALMASQMMLGGENGGSFSLAESLSNISEMAIESKLLEIQEQLNHDLLRQIFELNGMRTDVMPFFKFGDVNKPDLDVLSKFIQRVGAVGMLADTPETINWIADQAQMPKPFDDVNIKQDKAREALVGFTSNAGEGMTSGMGNGTGTSSGSSGDASSGNMENKSAYKVILESEDGVLVDFNGKQTKFSPEDWKELQGDS